MTLVISLCGRISYLNAIPIQESSNQASNELAEDIGGITLSFPGKCFIFFCDHN